MATEARINYKPGWTFTWVRQEAEPHLFIRIGVEQPDAKGTDPVTGDPRYVEFLLAVPEPFDPMWLHGRMVGIEAHEINEWLRVEGEQVVVTHG